MTAQRARTLTRPAGTDETRRGEEWQEDAACRQVDPDLFHAPDGEGPAEGRRRRMAAVMVCGGCEVREICLAHAVEHHERHGVWGGLTEEQRLPLIDAHRRSPVVMPGHACGLNRGTDAGYKAHRRAGERACPDCLEATRVASAERKARKRSAR